MDSSAFLESKKKGNVGNVCVKTELFQTQNFQNDWNIIETTGLNGFAFINSCILC